VISNQLIYFNNLNLNVLTIMITPSIEFFVGIPEELTDVRLRTNKTTGIHSVLMVFDRLNALEKLNSFTAQSTGNLHLIDEEGEIMVKPSSTKVIFGGDDGDDLKGVKCTFEVEEENHWQRIMRFLHRYADANGLGYGET
jgi:photosystem II Psb28-2 protein